MTSNKKSSGFFQTSSSPYRILGPGGAERRLAIYIRRGEETFDGRAGVLRRARRQGRISR
jgi:hypothetical protein